MCFLARWSRGGDVVICCPVRDVVFLIVGASIERGFALFDTLLHPGFFLRGHLGDRLLDRNFAWSRLVRRSNWQARRLFIIKGKVTEREEKQEHKEVSHKISVKLQAISFRHHSEIFAFCQTSILPATCLVCENRVSLPSACDDEYCRLPFC